MRILALTKYAPVAASTRQRFVQFAPYLRSTGIDVELSPLLDDEYLNRFARGLPPRKGAIAAAYANRLAQLVSRRDFDLLWVQYELFPYLPGALERLAKLSGRPIVCDYDDAIFHGYDRHRNILIRAALGGKLEPLLRSAALCICGNDYLAAYADRYCRHTMVVPTVVDAAIYKPRPLAADGGAPIIGWIGSPSTWRAYMLPLLPEILPVLKETGARLRAIGGGPSSEGIEGVEALEWAEAREVADVQSMDVGIMPLADDEWARGKCGYKLIQYMACGLPVIASPIGVNREIVSHGRNGLLPSTGIEWRQALRALIADSELRKRFGVCGRQVVVERYSLASQQPRLADALLKAAAR